MNNYSWKLILVPLFCTVFSLCAQAQNSATVLSNFTLGLEAYKEGKFRRAFDAWMLVAYEGNAEAQFNLGVLYLEGNGVERNAERARTWFMKAAEKNHVLAQYNLGHMALSGMGSEKNIQEAIKWWKLAAEGGHFQAQFNYGRALYLGIGGHEDKAGGLVFLRQAAVQKDKRAIKFLSENAEEIAKVIPAVPEAGSSKPVVADNKSLIAAKPSEADLLAPEPVEAEFVIVRDEQTIHRDYLSRTSNQPVTVYAQVNLLSPMETLVPKTLVNVTKMESSKVRIKTAAGLPVWAKRSQLKLQSVYATAVDSGAVLYTQPDGNKAGKILSGVRAKVIERTENWVKLRVSQPVYGWIEAKSLAYSGESAQQLREAWKVELQKAKGLDSNSKILAKKSVEMPGKSMLTKKIEIATSDSGQNKKPFVVSINSIPDSLKLSPEKKTLAEETEALPTPDDNAWLFTRGGNAQVIQLFTMLDHKKALSVAKQPAYRERAHLFTTRIKQQQWTFLLLGPYADEAAAIKARSDLPAHYAKHARVRPVSLIAKNRCAKRVTLSAEQAMGLDAYCLD
jgi:hypothetical protein